MIRSNSPGVRAFEYEMGAGSPVQDDFEDDGGGGGGEASSSVHLIEDQTQRKQVGTRIDHFASSLLGRHVGDGANGSAGTGNEGFVGDSGSGAGHFGRWVGAQQLG